MRDLVDSGRRAGLVWAVAREGAPLHLQAYGMRDKAAGRPMTTDTIFRLYSMTRAVSAVALLQLVEAGRVSLDDPVSKFIPSFATLRVLREVRAGQVVTAPATRPMLVRHLLSYTSGYGYVQYYPPEVGVKHLDILGLDQTIGQGIDKLATYPLLAEPGTRWDYGYHSDIIGRLIEVASGMRTDDFLQQRIFAPLGMVDTGFYAPPDKVDRLVHAYDTKGQDITAGLMPLSDWTARKPFQSNGGGLAGTAPDWIRFARMLLNGGELDGVRLLKPQTVAEMGRNQLTPAQGPLFWRDKATPDSPSRQAGYGWGHAIAVRLPQGPYSIPGTPGELTWAGFANTQYLIDRQHRLVALVFAQYLGEDQEEPDRVLRHALYGPLPR
jgi:CubicO group peptidase (beta-lactamase class C family)